MAGLVPANTTVILLSFEGPDRYSLAGGLGTRVTELSRSLAEAGYETHLLFVGDPHAPPIDVRCEGRLVLHRWCQWLSQHFPGGVYQGEEAKLADFTESVPRWVLETIAGPAIEGGRLVVIMAEEWQTAEALCRLSDLLHHAGRRSQAILLWNANNPVGFDRINWGRLGYVATITTVSRYMKHLMWSYGVNPLVIPNGVPRWLLQPLNIEAIARLRCSLPAPLVLSKVGRWDPDKRWLMAVETVARLKADGHDPVLLARGGVEPHGGEVVQHARRLGLRVATVSVTESSLAGYARALRAAGPADVLDIKSFVPLEDLRWLYGASDVVLANSGREPFGLVGLEAMAVGGVAFTGATGEDYVVHLENGIVLDTDDPDEAAWYIHLLREQPAVQARIRQAARRTAQEFVWERVLEILVGKLEFLAMRQGALPRPAPTVSRASRAALDHAVAEPARLAAITT